MSVVSVSRALGCLTAEASPLLGSRASRERHHDIERKHRESATQTERVGATKGSDEARGKERDSRKKRRGRSSRQPLSRSPGALARGGAIAERGGEEGTGATRAHKRGAGTPRAGRGAQPRAAEGEHPVRGADRRRFRTSAKLTKRAAAQDRLHRITFPRARGSERPDPMRQRIAPAESKTARAVRLLLPLCPLSGCP